MCTLVVVNGAVRGHAVVVAANRDEFLARPSSPPALHEPVGGQFSAGLGWIAPLDRQAGGTWLGLNARGVFVGLVNRGTLTAAGPVRSRGLVVRDALQRGSAMEIAAALGELVQPPCNPFALVCADERDAFLSVHGADGPRCSRLGPGAHVVCSRDPNDLTSRKVQRLQQELARVDWHTPLESWRPELERLLAAHPDAEQPLENPCVHRDGYGTRSSEIIARGPRGAWRWWHAEGPPCAAAFSEISELWERLQQVERRGVEDPATMTEETRL
jgi:uncharacterized protein with NRDE domain